MYYVRICTYVLCEVLKSEYIIVIITVKEYI